MQFQEVVEAQGHLIDSHIMEEIFDKVVEYNGRFEVEEFTIGRTNDDPTYLRLKVEAPTAEDMDHLLSQLLGLGCSPVDSGEAQLKEVERDCCAPIDFYSTTNHKTLVRQGGQWLEVVNQRMDASIVVCGGTAVCRRLRDVKAGDQVVVGMRGIRVVPEAKERDRHSFSFMSNEISSERQVETAVRQTASLIRRVREQGLKVVVVAGPVCVHTGGARGLAKLIRAGFVQVLLSGNALGVHDVESALLGTSLGIRMADGRQEEHGHRNHMRAINAIYHCGSIAGAVTQGRLQSGILYECVRNGSALRAGRQPPGRRAAAGHHHRHEPGAGRLCGTSEGSRNRALPGHHAALHRHRQHAPQLGQNCVCRYQPRRRNQSQRPRHRPRSGSGHGCRTLPGWPGD